MDYSNVAKQIFINVGGNENITGILSCFTRVRVEVKNKSLINEEAIKKLEGVQGITWQRNQFQIIMGGKCNGTYEELAKIVNIPDDNTDEKDEAISVKKQSIPVTVIDYITGSFQPIIPVLIGAGILQGLVALLNYTNIDKSSYFYQVVTICGNAGYFFLPILLAFSAGKKLRVNPYIAACIGAILVHPDMINLATSGDTYASFLGLPVTLVNYGASITPILLSIPVVMVIEKFAKKISPDILKAVLVPAITIIVSIPIILVVTGPAANIISTGIGYGINGIYNNLSIAGGFLIGLGAPFLVLTGLHQAAGIPIILTELSMLGYTMLFPILSFGNAAIAGAALGVGLRTKNKALKSTALSATIIGAVGITEPSLYGVLLPTKKPFIAVGIMSAICGALSLVFQVKSTGLGLCGLGGIPVFLGETFIYWAGLMILAYFGAAAIAFSIGFKEKQENI